MTQHRAKTAALHESWHVTICFQAMVTDVCARQSNGQCSRYYRESGYNQISAPAGGGQEQFPKRLLAVLAVLAVGAPATFAFLSDLAAGAEPPLDPMLAMFAPQPEADTEVPTLEEVCFNRTPGSLVTRGEVTV